MASSQDQAYRHNLNIEILRIIKPQVDALDRKFSAQMGVIANRINTTSGDLRKSIPTNDHTLLVNLTTTDAGHSQFVMLAGRAGGQSVVGGTAASEILTLGSTSNVTKGTVDIASGSPLQLLNQNEIRFREATGGGTEYAAVKAPAALAASYTLTLPIDDGTSGQALTTDGAGVLSWATVAGSNHNFFSATHTDTVAASPVLGDIVVGNSTPAWDKVAGNVTATKKFLRQTGTGLISALPDWDTIVDGDVPDILTVTKISNLTSNGFVKTGSGDGTLSVATTVAVAEGGTALTSYAVGDILYASGATTLAKLADVATGSLLASGGVGVAPAWSASPTLTTSLTVPTLYGSAAANGDLTLEGTSSATKTTSYVVLQPTGGNVGIGTSAPAFELEVRGNIGSVVVGNSAYHVTISYNSVADSITPAFDGRRARGTEGSPTQVLSGDWIVALQGRGYHSGGAFTTNPTGTVALVASENYTGSAQGTDLVISLCAAGGTAVSERARITGAGAASFETSSTTPLMYGSSAANGILTIQGTSHATKTTSATIIQPTGGLVGVGTSNLEAWSTTYSVLQVGGQGVIYSTASEAAGASVAMGQGLYYDGTWKYRNSTNDEAGALSMNNGMFQFFTAPSGAADAAATLTKVIEIANNGDFWAVGDVSALTFTDRTPAFIGRATPEIMAIKNRGNEIDHSTLPSFVRKSGMVGGKLEERRDLGAMISMLVAMNQEQQQEIETLKTKTRHLPLPT